MSASLRARITPRLVVLLVALAVAGWLIHAWWWGRGHVTTDNAQIDAHVVPVLARVGGFVTTLKVEDHQPVKAGEVIATIDDRDYRARLAQAEAELELALANAGRAGQAGQATAQAAAARAAAAAAHSGIEQALANADKARQDVNRVRPLVDKKMLSPQALDAAVATLRAAEAQVQVARDSAVSVDQQATASGAAVRAAVARVEAARAARDLAAIQLGETQIRAPAAGVVSNRSAEPGQLVAAGQPLLSVVALDDVWVVANLKETEIHAVRTGQRAHLDIDAYPGATVDGEVSSIGPATGARFALLPPDNATGNFTKVVQRVPVRIRVAQTADAARPLRPGMSVFVTIDTP